MYVWNVGGIQQGGATKPAVKKNKQTYESFSVKFRIS